MTGDGLDLEDYVRDSGAKVVIYSWNLEPDLIQRAMAGGARGYLSKVLMGPVIVEALERIMSGETVIVTGEHETSVGAVGDWPGRSAGLSPREAEVLALIAHGLTNKDIAQRAYVSPNTVKTYIRSAQPEDRRRAAHAGSSQGHGQRLPARQGTHHRSRPTATAASSVEPPRPHHGRAHVSAASRRFRDQRMSRRCLWGQDHVAEVGPGLFQRGSGKRSVLTSSSRGV